MLRPKALLTLVLLSVVPASYCQTGAARMPPDYRGVSVRVGGIFVTPVAGAPFTATVNIVSKQALQDGTEEIRTTINHIARDSAGRIYNERRAMEPASYKGDPPLVSGHIYDPATHMSTFLDPVTHLARQSLIQPRETTGANAPTLGRHDGGELTKVTDLGEQEMGTTRLRGTRKVWTVPAAMSGTGKAVSVVDEYWFSPELSVYLILKHDDPRTGEQIVAVESVETREPDASWFEVPARFKVVDETPVP